MNILLTFTTIIVSLFSCITPQNRIQKGEKRAKIYNTLPENLSVPEFLVCTENIDPAKIIDALRPYMYFTDNSLMTNASDYGLEVSYNPRSHFFIFSSGGENGIIYNRGVTVSTIKSETNSEFAVLCCSGYNVTLMVDGNTIDKNTVDLRTLALEGLREELDMTQEPQYVLPYNVAAQPDIYLPSTKSMTINGVGTVQTKGAALIGFGLTYDDYKIQLPDTGDRTEYGGADDNDIILSENDSSISTEKNDETSVVSIVISSVIGVALIYISYKLIRKTIRIIKGGA